MEHTRQRKRTQTQPERPFFSVMVPALTAGGIGLYFAVPALFSLIELTHRSGYRDLETKMYFFISTTIAITGLLASTAVYRRSDRSLLWSVAFFLSLFLVLLLHSYITWNFLTIPAMLQLAGIISLMKGKHLEKQGPARQKAAKEPGNLHPYPLKPGTRLKEKYRVVRGIDYGATGCVYLVSETAGGDREIEWIMKAVDLSSLPHMERDEREALFSRERAILSQLTHVAIPGLIDSFIDRGVCYLVMERVQGDNLEKTVQERGRPLSVDEALTLAEELLKILDYLHSQSPRPLIYRDLKPSNIMLTPKGKPRLIDFGIARFHVPGRERDTFVYGTPGFSPPEQYGTGQTDGRSDIYALGATLYYLLTLEDPGQFGFNFPPLSTFCREAPPALGEILARCLRRDPDERYQDLDELRADLQRLRGSLDSIDDEAGSAPSPFLLIGVAIAVATVSPILSLAGTPLKAAALAACILLMIKVLAGNVNARCNKGTMKGVTR